MLKLLKKHFIAGWGGYPPIGSHEQIVDGFAKLSNIGPNRRVGVLAALIADMAWFQRESTRCRSRSGWR